MHPIGNIKIRLPTSFYLKEFNNLPSRLNIEINGVIIKLAVAWIERLKKSRAPQPLPYRATEGIQHLELQWDEKCHIYMLFNIADLLAIYRQKLLPNIRAVDNASELCKLINLPKDKWEERGASQLNAKIIRYWKKIIPEGIKGIGFYEKYAWDKGAEIAAVGDIHGDDIRLISTLMQLVQAGFLDDHFRCRPHKYLIFLGDYVDRGSNNLKVLELLITLKLENPQQVHLIRGNHEDLNTTLPYLGEYAKNDFKYMRYLMDPQNIRLINLFYESLPLAIYVCQQTDASTKEYIQFCHGLFHLYTDPVPFLEGVPTRYWLKNDNEFSPRVRTLMTNCLETEMETTKEQKLRRASTRLIELSKKINIDTTNLYWLDIGAKFATCPMSGRTSIPPKTIKAYLQICSTANTKIKEIIRGHQGDIFTTQVHGKIVAITIDPSKDPHQQIYLEIKLAEKIRDCKKAFIIFPLPR